jgi:hypothetical protein
MNYENVCKREEGLFVLRTFMVSTMLWIAVLGPCWPQSKNMCASLIRQYEAAHGIPHKLLTAISLVESGRRVRGSVVAWPWTINANGKPYVFSTKYEAIAMVRKLRQKGITSIDVGCMQVNLKQHPGAFPTLDAAFDPATNIAYAAKFLKAKQMDKGSWGNAVAHYHSATAKYHVPYRTKVLKIWSKVQSNHLSYPDLLASEQSSLVTFLTNIDKHKGEFVKTVTTPGGRRVPLIVRFAPYKGFIKEKQSSSRVVISKERTDTIPVVFIDGKRQPIGKVITNKMMVPNGKLQIGYKDRMTAKIIRISTKVEQKPLKRKLKKAAISKFRAKSR